CVVTSCGNWCLYKYYSFINVYSFVSHQSAAAAPSPVLGTMPSSDGMPGGPMPSSFFQPFMSPRYAGGPRPPMRMGNPPPGGQPLPPNMIDPTRPTGHPNLAPMQRMNAPRGMGPMGPGSQSYAGGMRPPNSMGPGMPGVNMGPGTGRQWPNQNNGNTISYSSSSPGTYVGPPGGDSTNSGENLYTLINSVPAGGNRSSFTLGPGSDGPLGGLEPHHMNGSLGSGDLDGLSKNSPNNLSVLSNPPGTPRDDSELSGSFLHSFQNENYSPTMTMSV
ncbi:hypothetical protein DNTS_007086, partial [Danionella cerebrum]